MAAPTYITHTATTWNTNDTPKTADVAVQSGDIIVDLAAVESGTGTLGSPSGGSLTWTDRTSQTTSDSFCGARIGTAPATSATTVTVSRARTGSQFYWGHDALVFRGSDGVGAVASTDDGGSAASLAITTQYANSAIVVIIADWNAADGTTRTWRQVNGASPTEIVYVRYSAYYVVYVAYYADAGAAGSKTVGLTAPTGMKPATHAIEIRGQSSANAGTIAQSLSALTQAASVSCSASTSAAQVLSALTQGTQATSESASALTQDIPGFTQQTVAAASAAGVVSQTLAALEQGLTGSSAGAGASATLFSTTPSIAAVLDGATAVGVEFYVTDSGRQLTKIGFLAPSSGGDMSSTRVAALYSTTDGATGTQVVAPIEMPTPTAGQWCWLTLPTPVTLTANTRYRAVVWHDSNAGYAYTSAYFSTGDGATTTTLGGFLVRPNSTDALGADQGSYNQGGGTAAFTESSYNATNYWTDVEVVSAELPTASIDQSLPALSQEGIAAGSSSAAVAQALSALTQEVAASATATSTATIAQALPTLAQAQTVAAQATGAIGQTLDLPTMTATLTGSTAVTVAQTLPTLTESATATATGAAMGAQTLPALTQAGVGASTAAGSAAQTLRSLTQAALATAGSAAFANLTQTLPALTQATTAAGTGTTSISQTISALRGASVGRRVVGGVVGGVHGTHGVVA